MENGVKGIEQLLLSGNRRLHEAATCVDCQGGTAVRGGRWIKKKDVSRLKEIGQPVYMDEENILLYPLSHDMIIGSTGSGKTTVLYDNWINFYADLPKKIRPSFLVFDLKGDMYARHGRELEKKGYRLKVFNAREAFFSVKYNPLTVIYDAYRESVELEKALAEDTVDIRFRGRCYASVEEARAMAKALMYEKKDAVDRYVSEMAEMIVVNTDPKNLSWTEGARNCLKAILYSMLRETDGGGLDRDTFNMSSLCDAAFCTTSDYYCLIQWLKKNRDIPVVAGALSSCYELKAQITRDGYVSSLNSELNKYTSFAVSTLTSRPEIDFREITESGEDYAIFLVTDDRRQVTNNLAMMMLNDLITSLSEHADKQPTHALSKDFMVFADELANLPKLPGMSHKISTLRSRRIWLQMAIQSVEQLSDVYNEKVAATILDNCDLHLFLGCNNDETKNYFCRSMGQTIGIRRSAAMGATGVASISETTENVPVVRKSDLDGLALGEFFVRSRTCDNARSRMIPYFRRTDVSRERYALPIVDVEKAGNGFHFDLTKKGNDLF